MNVISFSTGDVSLVVDQALDVFNETSSLKVSASMVINQILLGAAGRGMNFQLLSYRIVNLYFSFIGSCNY